MADLMVNSGVNVFHNSRAFESFYRIPKQNIRGYTKQKSEIIRFNEYVEIDW